MWENKHQINIGLKMLNWIHWTRKKNHILKVDTLIFKQHLGRLSPNGPNRHNDFLSRCVDGWHKYVRYHHQLFLVGCNYVALAFALYRLFVSYRNCVLVKSFIFLSRLPATSSIHFIQTTSSVSMLHSEWNY